jgi:hypothetical protein
MKIFTFKVSLELISCFAIMNAFVYGSSSQTTSNIKCVKYTYDCVTNLETGESKTRLYGTYSYDSLGRLIISVEHPGSAFKHTYIRSEYFYNGSILIKVVKLDSLEDTISTAEWIYSDSLIMSYIVKGYGSDSMSHSYSYSFKYDSNGRLKKETRNKKHDVFETVYYYDYNDKISYSILLENGEVIGKNFYNENGDIYIELENQSGYFNHTLYNYSDGRLDEEISSTLNLLSRCKTIYAEGLDIGHLYSTNGMLDYLTIITYDTEQETDSITISSLRYNYSVNTITFKRTVVKYN